MKVNHRFKGMEDFCDNIDLLVNYYKKDGVYRDHQTFITQDGVKSVFYIK